MWTLVILFEAKVDFFFFLKGIVLVCLFVFNFLFICLFIFGCVGSSFLCEGFL